MVGTGFTVFDHDAALLRWTKAAHDIACRIAADPEVRKHNLRHRDTWFVGVDALPNAPDGSIGGVELRGPWASHIAAPPAWHPAQLSIVYPGYPMPDPEETAGNHRYRLRRHAAHVDGLLPVGPGRRRYLQEPHAFVLGIPLNHCRACPLMVWPGSHRVMGTAFRTATAGKNPQAVDLTEIYQAARRQVFDSIAPHPVVMEPGQSVLLHRHLLHGVAAWEEGDSAPSEGRMIAYFRPQFSAAEWLALP